MVDERALEEWKQLEEIIGRVETREVHTRGWMLVLLGAQVAALFSEKTRLPSPVFATAGISVVLLFAWIELVLRTPKRRAIARARQVEASLRDPTIPYDGPLLTESFTGPNKEPSWQLMFREVRTNAFWAFYLAAAILVAVFACATP